MAGLLPDSHFPFIISVAEVPLPELILNDIEEVVINTNLNMPGMFSIRLRDVDPLGTALPVAMQYADNPLFSIGVPVSIKAVAVDQSPVPGFPIPLIKGEITSIEAQFEAGPASLVISGYDKSHRLNRGKKTATYMFMPDNLIVQKVTAAAGLMCTAIPTGAPREYVLQNNQSDMDFLKDIARRNGYELVMNALGILMFKPIGVPLPGPPGPLLTWRKDLFSFNPRLSAANQDAVVQVHGSDMKKFPAEGLSPSLMPASGGSGALPQLALARSIFGVTKDHITDTPVSNVGEAMALAKGRATALASQFTQADGECKGNPRVQAGSIVMVAGVGVKFSGAYLVSSSTHRYSGNTGYVTQFAVTGAQPDTLGDLLNASPDTNGRINGVVVGQVTNNIDPLMLGRVKVKLPHLGLMPPIDSNWCRIASPWAGGKISGFLAIPEINDEVLIAFEQGDPNFPYIIGQLWNMIDRPPSLGVVAGGLVTKRIIKSRSGHTITLSDMPGKEGISIVDKTMMNKFEIDSIKNSLSIFTLGDVTIDCLNFKVNSKAIMELKALAKVSIDGTAGVDIKSAAKVGIEGTALLDLKGSLVNIKSTGGGSIAIMGPQVNINNGALEVI